MQILIVNFNLDGLSEEEFASSCDELAPAFAAVPGLASKVWLADRAEGIFGGVYTFESEKAVDDYLSRTCSPESARHPACEHLGSPLRCTRRAYPYPWVGAARGRLRLALLSRWATASP